MRHEDVRNHLSDYIEGLLDSALAAAIDNHLRECDGCERELVTLRKVYHALDDPSLNVAPPPMFHADVMRRVRLAARPGADRRGFWERLGWPRAVAATAAGLALLAGVVVSVGPLGDGIRAGFTPRVPAVTTTTAPLQISGEFRPGSEVYLRLPNGSRVTLEVTSGIVEHAVSGDAARLSLGPDTAGSVQEAVLRGRGAGWMVFIPVQTGGSPESRVNWNPRPATTLQSAVETAARVYGVPISAPESALNASVSVSLSEADAAVAIPAIAAAAGRTATHSGAAWSLE